MNRTSKKDIINMICIIVIMFFVFIFLHDIKGSSILGRSMWNSYSLQAQSWLQGRTDVDSEHASYLELAVYEGKYYVSFPPLPSVVMLPFVALFGTEAPDNLVIAAFAVATAICAYRILRNAGTRDLYALFISLFYVLGCNVLAMSLDGGVWFTAQTINMFLCTLAVGFFLMDRRMASYLCLALAVGCRPFSAIYIVAFFIIYLYRDYKAEKLGEFVKRHVYPALPVVGVAVLYMMYNYVRFDNPFEFGHNYLPEFTESKDGQFSFVYFFDNLKRLLIGPVRIDGNLNLSFEKFNGFMFYVANPIFLILLGRMFANIKNRRVSQARIVIAASMLVNLFLLCCHKTLGGWQFGARYTCDMIPFALLYMMIGHKQNPENAIREERIECVSSLEFNRLEITIAAIAIMFNIFGAVEFWLDII